ncbi:MAG: acetyl-CoA carboxylase biotin carboxyl carrier protein [Candidatus Omnitrophica bacterium]|jgi:oxaloacetate decarboxylase alpha subunit|nr:acetyl-CoA carboxylase biotin carboxyl carrier protein [Candidatus Omnitrophota bacterium]
MNLKEIKEMLNLMSENDLVELEIEKEGMRVRLKKMGSGSLEHHAPIMIERQNTAQLSSSGQPVVKPQEQADSSRSVEIKSPMVGTFYRAPSPEAPPYIEVGQIVEPGQVICIIEAMKLMNEIKSEIKGRVAEVLADNAEPVEYGQSLFLVEPV